MDGGVIRACVELSTGSSSLVEWKVGRDRDRRQLRLVQKHEVRTVDLGWKIRDIKYLPRESSRRLQGDAEEDMFTEHAESLFKLKTEERGRDGGGRGLSLDLKSRLPCESVLIIKHSRRRCYYFGNRRPECGRAL